MQKMGVGFQNSIRISSSTLISGLQAQLSFSGTLFAPVLTDDSFWDFEKKGKKARNGPSHPKSSPGQCSPRIIQIQIGYAHSWPFSTCWLGSFTLISAETHILLWNRRRRQNLCVWRSSYWLRLGRWMPASSSLVKLGTSAAPLPFSSWWPRWDSLLEGGDQLASRAPAVEVVDVEEAYGGGFVFPWESCRIG